VTHCRFHIIIAAIVPPFTHVCHVSFSLETYYAKFCMHSPVTYVPRFIDIDLWSRDETI
jgi:hypothetical protein